MNKEALKPFIDFMLQSLKDIKTFTLTQLPPFCHEILNYFAIKHAFWGIFGFLLMLVVIPGIVYVEKMVKKHNDDDFRVFYFLLVFPLLIGFVIFSYNLLEVMKIWTAPKLFLLEYFSSLIK